jgi:microcystin-dependent protein
MRLRLAAVGLAACALMSATSASADTPFVGEVRLFGFNFCPNGWYPADGRVLPISQYQALFALYGITYGGNGTSNFNLPNLQGRAPTGASASEPVGTAYGGSAAALPPSEPPLVRPRRLGSGAAGTSPSLAMTWCVAYLGVFPSRN